MAGRTPYSAFRSLITDKILFDYQFPHIFSLSTLLVFTDCFSKDRLWLAGVVTGQNLF